MLMPEHLLEVEQIKQLKARYFRLMDTRRWSEWAEVFTPDAQLRWGPADGDVVEGRGAIVKAVSGQLADATTWHHGHMPEIEILDATRARGVWAMEDFVETPLYVLHGIGHYEEEYRKHEGAWRIHRLRLTRLREDRRPRDAQERRPA